MSGSLFWDTSQCIMLVYEIARDWYLTRSAVLDLPVVGRSIVGRQLPTNQPGDTLLGDKLLSDKQLSDKLRSTEQIPTVSAKCVMKKRWKFVTDRVIVNRHCLCANRSVDFLNTRPNTSLFSAHINVFQDELYSSQLLKRSQSSIVTDTT